MGKTALVIGSLHSEGGEDTSHKTGGGGGGACIRLPNSHLHPGPLQAHSKCRIWEWEHKSVDYDVSGAFASLLSLRSDLKEEMVFSQTLAPLWQRFLKNSPGSCKAGIVATCSTDERYVQPIRRLYREGLR